MRPLLVHRLSLLCNVFNHSPPALVAQLALPPQPTKIKDKGEKGHSRSTVLVSYAIPLNPPHPNLPSTPNTSSTLQPSSPPQPAMRQIL